MDSMTTLLRFLYLGSDQCLYIAKTKPITNEEIVNSLQCICSMAEGRFDLPFSVIKRIIESNSLPRNNEAFMALAFCLRHVGGEPGIKLRQLIYAAIPDLLRTDNDLFLFVKYTHDILQQPMMGTNPSAATPSKGFGRGMRKAIGKWYEKRTALELANIYGRNLGMHKWTHLDLIRLCHLNFGTDPDKIMVMNAIAKRSFRVLKEHEERLANGTLTPGLTRLCHIMRFKTCESIPQSVNMIKEHQFGLAHMPSHFYDNADIWMEILANMTYSELLDKLPTMYGLNLLKLESALSKKVYNLLGNQALISASKPHPIEIFVLKKNYEKNKRFSDPVKNERYHQRKSVAKRNIMPNPHIVKRLNAAINQSFQFFPKIGASFLITLDLRGGSKKRSVFGMNNVTCLEAMVVLTLAIVKREKSVHVRSFTDCPQSLQVVNITEKDNFDKAYNYCVDNVTRKTLQSLALPIQYATHRIKQKIDVFLTITDSVARFCRHGRAPLDEFRRYKAKHKQAKYIVLSLSRHDSDLNLDGEKGFLEICGLNASVPRIIHAFAKNHFS